MSTPNLDRARAAWGEDMPDWVRMLANACDQTSQSKAAERLRYSTGAVNAVLARKYGKPGASYEAIAAAVRGAFMDAQVQCPVLGELRQHVCMEHQRQPFAATNPTRVRLYRACRAGCPHSLISSAGVTPAPAPSAPGSPEPGAASSSSLPAHAGKERS